MSSEALAHYALGGPKPSRSRGMGEYPHDDDDLGRCERVYRDMPASLRARALPMLVAFRESVRKENERYLVPDEEAGPACPSKAALSMVGRVVKVTEAKRDHTREVTGKVLDVRASGTTIEDIHTGASWPGIKFRIQPQGGRAVWTSTFADREDSPFFQSAAERAA